MRRLGRLDRFLSPTWREVLGGTLLLAACATVPAITPQAAGLGREPYRIGPLLVLVRSQAEVQRLCPVRPHEKGPGRRVHGCYLRDAQTIITTEDLSVFLHELKHHFEGAWHE